MEPKRFLFCSILFKTVKLYYNCNIILMGFLLRSHQHIMAYHDLKLCCQQSFKYHEFDVYTYKNITIIEKRLIRIIIRTLDDTFIIFPLFLYKISVNYNHTEI